MIDEYQDSNLIQEAILTSVSKQSRGEYNLFMVGDVKQSIYRFRMSRPELFLEKYQTYTPEPSKEQKIDLHKNFRSRKEVLDIVNFIFFRIMKPELSKITYDKKAALYVGANYPQQNEVGSIHPNCAEYLFVDVSTEGEEVSADDAEEEAIEAREWEARAVATRIKHLMNTFQVVESFVLFAIKTLSF
jgi:ATP-dependent helicase/nuclease subunit A